MIIGVIGQNLNRKGSIIHEKTASFKITPYRSKRESLKLVQLRILLYRGTCVQFPIKKWMRIGLEIKKKLLYRGTCVQFPKKRDDNWSRNE